MFDGELFSPRWLRHVRVGLLCESCGGAFLRRGAKVRALAFIVVGTVLSCGVLRAQDAPRDTCPRPAPGSAVQEPEDLRSENGVLRVDLTVRNSTEKDGSTRYCYLLADGHQSPTLRVSPGDLLILGLKNDLSAAESAGAATAASAQQT